LNLLSEGCLELLLQLGLLLGYLLIDEGLGLLVVLLSQLVPHLLGRELRADHILGFLLGFLQLFLESLLKCGLLGGFFLGEDNLGLQLVSSG
jgi:hypothetical protein